MTDDATLHPEPVEDPLRRPLPWAEHGPECAICTIVRSRQAEQERLDG